MQTVRLGRTGVDVSVAGLGCGGHSRLGMTSGATSEEAAKVVRAAVELGVTFIDTARVYGTEEAVGIGLDGRRDGVFISTKSPPTVRWDTDELLTPEGLAHNLDSSLRRLRTDRIDLFNLHGVRAAVYDRCVEALLPELQRQQAAGKIRFVGITENFGSDTRHEMLPRAVADGHFDVVMVGFSLLNPGARRSVFPLTLKHEVGTLIMFAVRRALSQPEALRDVVADLVARGQVDPAKVDAADPLGFLREHPDVGSVVEAAYRFCRHEPGADVILTGTGSVEHLKANLAAIEKPRLPAELGRRLEEIFAAVDSISGN